MPRLSPPSRRGRRTALTALPEADPASAAGPPPAAGPGRRRRFRPTQLIPTVVGVGAIVALVVASNPGGLGRAIARFDLVLIPVILALSATF